MILRLVVAACVSLWAATTAAQNRYKPICDAKDKRLCVVALVQGEVAPYNGQLLTTELAIRQGQMVEQCDARMGVEVDRVKQLGQVEIDLERKLRAIDVDAHDAQIALMKIHIEKAGKRSWLEHPAVVATMTAVVVVGAIYAGTQIVQVAAK